MRVLKKAGSAFLILAFAALFLAPVGILWKISQAEQQQYLPASDVVLEDLAYGEIKQITRMDIPETITVSGNVVSTATEFMELGKIKDTSYLRMVIENGQIVQEGDVIAYNNGEPILADKSGIVKSYQLGADSYVWLQSLADLALRIEVSEDSVLSTLQQEGIALTDADGVVYRVLEIEPTMTQAGNAVVLLRCEGKPLVYGQRYENLTLQTGRVFQQALVVEKDCVYTPAGSDKTYIREVDAYGKYLQEVEVKTGYRNADFICVSGVREGTFCDSGYKAVVESRGNS